MNNFDLVIGMDLADSKILIESLPQYFFYKSIDGIYLGCNKNFASLLNVSAASWIVGKDEIELSFRLSGQAIAELNKFDDTVIMGNSVSNVKMELLIEKNRKIIALVSKSPLFDDQDNVVAILCSFTDFSEVEYAIKRDFFASNNPKFKLYNAPILVNRAVREIIFHYERTAVNRLPVITFSCHKNSSLTFIFSNYLVFKQTLMGLLDYIIASTNISETISRKKITFLIKSYENTVSINIMHNGYFISPQSSCFAVALSNAVFFAQCCCGAFTVESLTDSQATFNLQLPIAPPPDFFVTKLVVPNKKLVLFSDNRTVLKTLEKRSEIETGILLRNVDNAAVFLEELGEHLKDKAVFLIDYILPNNRRNGLDFIRELNIAACSILLTHSDDEELKIAAAQLKIRILPEQFLSNVPIVFSQEN